MSHPLSPLVRIVAPLLLLGLGPWQARAAEKDSAYQAALESITAPELGQHVALLTDPKMEGREAGTRGGHAAAEYLAGQLALLHLQSGAGGQSYFQPFRPNLRNVLALLPGSDPQLRSQVVLIGAHYDHVGHGLQRPSGTPPAIHPGADDNASGDSAVLEVAQAFTLLPAPPRRSVLFAFWDGEEKGLLGSKHWAAHPTVKLEQVAAAINVDMIGGLRGNRLAIVGSRSGCGLRRLVADRNRETGLLLDFEWTCRSNADHYPFIERNIPTVMMHTGMHETYHKPTDTPATLDREGMQRVTRLIFGVAYELAERQDPPRFRAAARHENDQARRQFEQPEPSPVRPGDPPLRLGISWRTDQAEPAVVMISHVVPGTPAAAAGLRAGDRIYQIAGRSFLDDEELVRLAKTLPGPLELVVERDGQFRVVVVRLGGEAKVKRAA